MNTTFGEGFQHGYLDCYLGECLMVAWLRKDAFGDGYRAGWYHRKKEADNGQDRRTLADV